MRKIKYAVFVVLLLCLALTACGLENIQNASADHVQYQVKDISIQYTKYLNIDNVDYEIEYTGLSYNVENKGAHVSSIRDDYVSELWYGDDYEYFDIDTESDAKDEYLHLERMHLNVFLGVLDNVVKEVWSSPDTTVKVEGNTQRSTLEMLPGVYTVSTNGHVFSDEFDHVVWEVSVDENTYGPLYVTMTYYYKENENNILYERLNYEVRWNTGFDCIPPEYRESVNTHENISNDAGDAGM